MKFKSLLSLAAVAAAACVPFSTVSAQAAPDAEGKGPRKMPSIEERLAKMKTDLGLSDDQVGKLKAIFEQQKAAADPVWKDKTLSRDQKREKLKPIMDDTKTKIDAVLTPDQQAKLKAIRKERRDEKKNQ